MFRLVALLLSFAIVSCDAREIPDRGNSRHMDVPPDVFVVDRVIDDRLVAEARRALATGKYSTVRLQSTGGQANSAFDLLELVSRTKVALEVASPCLSACAEVALLSGQRVRAVGRPVLGFHSNAFSNEILLKKFRHDRALACFERNVAKDYAGFLGRKPETLAAYRDFSAEMVSLLGFYKSRDTGVVSPRSGCPWIEFASRHKFWFPDSSQLKSYFGDKFVGELASDDAAFATDEIASIFGHTGTVVIGTAVVDLGKQGRAAMTAPMSERYPHPATGEGNR